MEEKPILNPEILSRFREQFNKGDFGYLRYSNRNGRNDFSAICSSMDWITVAIYYINNFKLSSGIRTNEMSMEIFSLIMAVDMIYSCIKTMHQVVLNKPGEPFYSDHDIFSLEKSDRDHFKDLRAAFGAHTTKLNIVKGETKYSSWSVAKLGDEKYDFKVYLSSSIPGKIPEPYGFKVDDLIRFAEKRYGYLEVLTEELKNQDAAILEALKERSIKKSNNLQSRLAILKEAAKERYIGRDQYYYALIDIETMIYAPCTFKENNRAVKKYKQLLHHALNNIENNLQQMEFEKFPSLDIIHPKYRPSETTDRYIIGKIYEEISGGLSLGMMPYHLERAKPYFKGVQEITPELGKDELLLLVNTGLYFAGIKTAEAPLL